jgi:hypothetical protein
MGREASPRSHRSTRLAILPRSSVSMVLKTFAISTGRTRSPLRTVNSVLCRIFRAENPSPRPTSAKGAGS